MRLLINTESLRPPLTGIGNYTFNLLNALQRMSRIERLDCFSGSGFSTAEVTLAKCIDACSAPPNRQADESITTRIKMRFRESSLAYRAREAWRNGRMLTGSLGRRDYVYHEPSFILKAHRGPCVATIHDLSFVRYPQFHPRQRVEWLLRQLPKTLRRADAIITDSEYIRQELIGEYNVDPGAVKAIHLGVSDLYRPKTEIETQHIMDLYGLRHGHYLLFVGTLEPRKGIDTLLDAWLSLPPAMQLAYPLVLAGAPGWNDEALRARISALIAKRGVKQLNFVPEKSLPALYSGAALFVFPSLYEGFGLPLLEAMSCGAPTLCSADTSMSEFAARGTQLFKAGDACHLAERMQHLLGSLETREETARAGLLRSQQLSWDRCAQQTFEVYASLAG